MKNDARSEYVLRKMSDFISFPLFDFTLILKLRNFYTTIINFFFFLTLRNFDFKSHWHTLILFDKKNDVRFEYLP